MADQTLPPNQQGNQPITPDPQQAEVEGFEQIYKQVDIDQVLQDGQKTSTSPILPPNTGADVQWASFIDPPQSPISPDSTDQPTDARSNKTTTSPKKSPLTIEEQDIPLSPPLVQQSTKDTPDLAKSNTPSETLPDTAPPVEPKLTGIQDIGGYIQQAKAMQAKRATRLTSWDGVDLTKTPEVYAIIPHSKGDHKLVFFTSKAPQGLIDDPKHRIPGTVYAKNGEHIYDVHVTMKKHPALKNERNEPLDVWLIDDSKQINAQIDAIAKGKWGGINFGTPMIFSQHMPSGQELRKQKRVQPATRPETSTSTPKPRDTSGEASAPIAKKDEATIETPQKKVLETKKDETPVTAPADTTKQVKLESKKEKWTLDTAQTKSAKNDVPTKVVFAKDTAQKNQSTPVVKKEITNNTPSTPDTKEKVLANKPTWNTSTNLSDQKNNERMQKPSSPKALSSTNTTKNTSPTSRPSAIPKQTVAPAISSANIPKKEIPISSPVDVPPSTGSVVPQETSAETGIDLDQLEAPAVVSDPVVQEQVEIQTMSMPEPVINLDNLEISKPAAPKEAVAKTLTSLDTEFSPRTPEKKTPKTTPVAISMVLRVVGLTVVVGMAWAMYTIMFPAVPERMSPPTKSLSSGLTDTLVEDTTDTNNEHAPSLTGNGVVEDKEETTDHSGQSGTIVGSFTLPELEAKLTAQQKEAQILANKAKLLNNKEAIKFSIVSIRKASDALKRISNDPTITASELTDIATTIDLYLQEATRRVQ